MSQRYPILIDIKAELAFAQDNVSLYRSVEVKFTELCNTHKLVSQEYILKHVLARYDMSLEDFRFIQDIEYQHFLSKTKKF